VKHGTFFTAVMTALVVLTACGAPPTQPKPPVVQPPPVEEPPPPAPSPTFAVTKIMAFGDSLTEGDPPEPGQIRLLPIHDPSTPGGQKSYPYKLSTLLTTTYPTSGVQVFNHGKGGEAASGSAAKDRLAAALAKHQPQVLLLMHGANDLISEFDIPQNAVVDALEEMIELAQRSPGMDRVFLASLPPQLPSTERRTVPGEVPIFNNRLRNLAAATGAEFVDIFPNIDTQTMMAPDGLHLNEAGNQKMAEVFYAALKPRYHRDPQ
jgi:lysophospholipase L1-like esterase